MSFLGYTFCAGQYSAEFTPTNILNINDITIRNGIYGDLYLTKEIVSLKTDVPPEWNYDTILQALFQNTLSAGNVDFQASQVSAIRIKRRVKGTYTWITLFEITVTEAADLQFEIFDKYARGNGTEYEYALVPIINDVEGNISIVSVISEFDGIFIMEKEESYGTEMNYQITPSRVRPSASVSPLGQKYAVVTTNGINNHFSANVSCTFIYFNEVTDDFEPASGIAYREQVYDCMLNGRPKIFKTHDGLLKLISVVGNLSEDQGQHSDMPTTSLTIEEIGDAESSHTLYLNDLIDVDIEGV